MAAAAASALPVNFTRDQALAVGARVPWDSYVPASLSQADVKAIRALSAAAPARVAELLAARDAEALLYPQALVKVRPPLARPLGRGLRLARSGAAGPPLARQAPRPAPNTKSTTAFSFPALRAVRPPLPQTLTSVSDVRVIQYALTLLRDFVEGDPERRARLVTRPGAGPGAAIFVQPVLQLVGTSGSGARILSAEAHPYVVEQAAVVAACMVAADPSDEGATSGFLSWVLTNIKLFGAEAPPQARVSEAAAQALMVLMRSEYLRALLLEERGVERLLPLLAARNAQIAYNAGFCLWVLSLHRPGSGAAGAGVTGVEELARGGAVAALAAAARTGQPMKLLRVVLGTLANVARAPGAAGAAARAELALTHVPGVLAQLLALDPRVPDPELYDDAKWLAEALAAAAAGAALGNGFSRGGALAGGAGGAASGVERLERELASGRLEWGPTHTADFWKQNAARLEREGDFAVVKALLALLEPAAAAAATGGAAAAPADPAAAPAADAVTQAVALHDVGEFAAQHPQGRAIVAALGAKPLIMALLKRAEGDVKHQALLALSKCMIKSYAFVGAGGGAGAAGAAVAAS
jgi:hypothetical protein